MNNQEKKVLTYINRVTGDPWALQILWLLSEYKRATYIDIRSWIVYVTNTDLKKSLQMLTENQLLQFDGDFYSMTKRGKEWIPLLKYMIQWGNEHIKSSMM